MTISGWSQGTPLNFLAKIPTSEQMCDITVSSYQQGCNADIKKRKSAYENNKDKET